MALKVMRSLKTSSSRQSNECEIVLFMYSKAHSKILDFEKDWTVRELNFAEKKNKRIVFVNLDGSPLSDTFEFDYGTKQQINALSHQSILRLIADLRRWLGISQKQADEIQPRKTVPNQNTNWRSEIFSILHQHRRIIWESIGVLLIICCGILMSRGNRLLFTQQDKRNPTSVDSTSELVIEEQVAKENIKPENDYVFRPIPIQ